MRFSLPRASARLPAPLATGRAPTPCAPRSRRPAGRSRTPGRRSGWSRPRPPTVEDGRHRSLRRLGRRAVRARRAAHRSLHGRARRRGRARRPLPHARRPARARTGRDPGRDRGQRAVSASRRRDSRHGQSDLDPIAGMTPEVVWTSERLGHAAARNVGLRRAAGAIVVLADGSIEPTGDALTPLEAALADPADRRRRRLRPRRRRPAPLRERPRTRRRRDRALLARLPPRRPRRPRPPRREARRRGPPRHVVEPRSPRRRR